MIPKQKTFLLMLMVLLLSSLVQSQENIKIEYGVAFNKIAIDTATIENEEVKKHVLKSENESKRLLKDDRTLAILTFEDKNKAALQNLDPELKDKKLKSLKAGRLQVNLFIRTKAMEKFKNKNKE